jgi:hypothetical protein
MEDETQAGLDAQQQQDEQQDASVYPPVHTETGGLNEEDDEEDDDEDDDDDDVGAYDDDDDEALPEYDITLNGLSSYLHALELGIDLPTIDLTNQGIGDHGMIELLDKLQVCECGCESESELVHRMLQRYFKLESLFNRRYSCVGVLCGVGNKQARQCFDTQVGRQ